MNKLNRKLKQEQRVRRRHIVLRLLKRIFLFVLIPAVVGSLMAFLERGYLAVGGEVFFPFLGIIWILYLYFYPYHEN